MGSISRKQLCTPFVTHTFHQPKHPSSTHLQASAAFKQQELEALQAEQAQHSSAVERQLAQAECRAAESQAACEDAQAQLLAAREHQQELSRQVYIAKQAEQQLRAKVGPALAWQVLQGKGRLLSEVVLTSTQDCFRQFQRCIVTQQQRGHAAL